MNNCPAIAPPPIGLHHNSMVACLATIPARGEEARRAVESLLPQMDAVVCVFNFGPGMEVPNWISKLPPDANFYPYLADNSRGDAMKFAVSEHLLGYQFIRDDDIVYPSNYAKFMVGAIEKYNRQAVVGLGGSVFSGKVASYYEGRHKHGHALRQWNADTNVNVLTTCAVAFHSSLLRIPLCEFRAKNMADIFLALACQRRGVPMVCLGHDANLLGYQRETMKGKWTICGCRRDHDAIQASYLNEINDWKVFRP